MEMSNLVLLIAKELHGCCTCTTKLEDFSKEEIKQVEKVIHYVELYHVSRKNNRNEHRAIQHEARGHHHTREF